MVKRDVWMLSECALKFVLALAEEREVKTVLEFGAGLSTAALSKVAIVTSVESDPDHATKWRPEVKPPSVIQFAPLVFRHDAPQYLIADDLLPPDPDMILVDGPPGGLGGRRGVLKRAFRLAGRKTVVCVDDALRMRTTPEGWRKTLVCNGQMALLERE